MVVSISDARVVIAQAAGEKDRTENKNNSFHFLDEVSRGFTRCSLQSGASGCLHIAIVDLIISSDVCFCRVTGTPCPSSEQISSEICLRAKSLFSASMIQPVHGTAYL